MSKPSSQPPSPVPATPVRRLRTVALLVVVLALGLHGHVLDLGLLGHDSFPLLAASRIEAPADLLSPWTHELMDGRFRGAFYRPVYATLLSVEQVLWGAAPAGYQFVNLLAICAAGLALFALVRRMLGPRALVGPSVASAAFLLHPGLWEVVPVVARRSDTLGALFLLAGLALVVRQPGAWRLALGAFVATLLATGSNEKGFALAPLACLAALLFPSGRSGARSALLAGAGAGAGALLALGARFAVLGGLGGYASAGEGLARHAARLGGWLLLPPQVVPPALGVPSAVGLALFAALVALALHVGRRASAVSRAVVLGVAIIVLATLLTAAGGQSHPWYLLIPSAGLALVLGGLSEGALAATRPLRSVGVAVVALCLLGGVAAQIALHRARTWQAASIQLETYLGGLEHSLAGAGPDSLVTAPEPPERERVPKAAVGVRGASILLDYSLEAWADLRFPGRRISFVRRERGTPPPLPREDGPLVVLPAQVRGAARGRRNP